jgi:hypothetical protein
VSRRITITIDDGIDDEEAIDLVHTVIEGGRISNYETQYCYATTFRYGPIVYADKTRTGNDTFRVWRRKP